MKKNIFISVFLLFSFKIHQGYGTTLKNFNEESIFKEFQKFASTLSKEDLNNYTFDYRFSRISDVEVGSSVSIKTILDNINTRIKNAISFSSLHFVFSENYISDRGFKIISEFLIQNPDLSNKIMDIDLSNNRISKNSVSEIENLLATFPNLQLDLSINYLSNRDLIDLSESIKDRITYNAY